MIWKRGVRLGVEADCRCESVEGVGEPCIELVGGRGERGRWDVEGLDRPLQAFPVGFVPHGSGGGTLIGWRSEVDEDGDVV